MIRVRKYLKRKISKILILGILILIILIGTKNNSKLRDNVKYYVYEDSFSFMKTKKFYDKYLGGNYFGFDTKIQGISMVFNSKLDYSNLEEYKDGVRLKVRDNYLVPSLKNGIVTFIGEKDGYGKTVIIEDEDGIGIWYGNLDNIAVNIYDTISKGTYLGEASGNYIYLVYSKGKKILDYKKYFN